MSKETKFSFDGTTLSYTIADGMVATANLGAALANPEFVKAALTFSLKTAARNATAGKMEDALAEAFEAVKTRFESWSKGVWTARRESDAESVSSMLTRAFAAAMQCSEKDAAAYINDKIEGKMEDAGIDPDASADDLDETAKKTKAKIGRDTRKAISEDPAVALALAQVKLADQTAKLAKVAEGVKGKTSALTGATL